jgi:phosphoribosylglycinamide formyltransferase-1
MNIVVLVSGRGSNLRAICDAIDAGTCDAVIHGVVSDRSAAAALEFANGRGIPTRVVSLRKGDDRDSWNESLAAEVADLGPDLIVLAGFMRVLGPPLLERFPGRIINVHPALLPSFPGHSAPQEALDRGVRISGCTVHIVDAGVDTGPILAQAAVPVLADDTADSLHRRIQIQEHRLLPRVIHQIAIGAITLHPLIVRTPVADPIRTLTVPDA